MADLSFPGLTRSGTHAGRPAASAVGDGTKYSCTDHNLIYEALSGSWGTWFDPGTSSVANLDDIGDVAAASPSDGDVLTFDSGSGDWINAAPTGGGGDYAFSSEQVAGAGGLASFDFTSIPGTGRHLVIECLTRSEKSAAFDTMHGRLNNDSSAIYNTELRYSFGGTTGSVETISQTRLEAIAEMAAASADANLFSYTKIWFPFYANTVAQKVGGALSWEPLDDTTSGSRQIKNSTLQWRSTAAITRVTLFTAANDWAEGSRAALYIID